MQEVKFRVYIKRARIIANVRAINFEQQFILTSVGTRYEFSDIVLMQYTWLKDSAGVEIYEGDVVYYTTIEKVSVDYRHWIRALHWLDTMCHDFQNKAFVLWNIHQNPELIKS